MARKQIYLDTNVYLSIANREANYEYTLTKVKKLSQSGHLFPHAPPHAEELSARFLSGRDIPATFRTYNLVNRFNDGFGLVPGYCNIEETEEIIRSFSGHPELEEAMSIHLSVLERLRAGKISEKQFSTLLIKEDLGACMSRVDKYLDLTDVAKRNELFHFGRRDQKTLQANFEEIQKPPEGVATFLETQKKFNLGPRRLSRIPPEEIFDDKCFFDFISMRFSEAGMSFNSIPTGISLAKSHHKKETIITKILNCMEEAGYNQEEKNHAASLTGRMHDVSHAIYATATDHLVTNDKRFTKKVVATYLRLGIPTKILNIDEFVHHDFTQEQSIIYLNAS